MTTPDSFPGSTSESPARSWRQNSPSPQHSRWPTTFRALRHRNYRLWFGGQGISLIGTWMQNVAMQVLVYRMTGSATALGIVGFIGIIPTIPLSLWGGSLADRVSKRTVILAAQVVMMLVAIVLALLTGSGAARVWQVYLLSLVLAAATAVDLPVRQAFTVEMVEGKEDLSNAIGLNSAMFNGARALGPALAGLAVATTGESTAFVLNAVSFLPVIASLLLMRNLPKPKSGPTGNVCAHMVEGAAFIHRDQTLLVLISLVAVSAVLAMPFTTLMPVFATGALAVSARPIVGLLCDGSQAFLRCRAPEALPLGLLLTTMGLGALVGALLVASLPERARRGRMLTLGNLAFPAFLLVFAGTRSFLVAAAALFFTGISFVWQNALANTLLQLHTPDELRGRVMSVYTLVFQMSMRLGSLQAGWVGDRLGAPWTVALNAAVALSYGIYVALRYPKVRDLT